ncbi:MAG: hypothetical protein WCL06_00730 [Bacteroidota bacterium]
MKKTIKISLFVIIMLMLFMPLLQQQLHLFRVKPLNGFFETHKRPDTLNWKTWSDESFQKKYNRSVEDSFGLREILIRTNNQLNYWLYKKTDAHNVIIGKNNCLYEEGYILDYTGANFVGETYLNEVLRRTKMVQDTLKKAKNIDLIIVYEPGKASYYPELIPDRYHPYDKKPSNMKYLVARSKEIGLQYLDLCSWFVGMKDTVRYPVYSNYGVHWTTYGMFRAGDTLSKFIEGVRHIDMPEMIWRGYKITEKAHDEDFDIEATMNLLFDVKHISLCYPQVGYNDRSAMTKPKLLTVGDSYYWGLQSNGIIDNLFRDQEYWYYFRGIWPNIWTMQDIPKVLNLQERVEKQEVILVMITELNTYRAFWGFTDALYNIYFPNATPNPDYIKTRYVIDQDPGLSQHLSEARKRQKSVEEVIRESVEEMR